MPVKLTLEDRSYIAYITGNHCTNYSWRFLSLYGVREIYGGQRDETNFEYLDDEQKFYFQRIIQYADSRWIIKRNEVIKDRKYCEHCGTIKNLQVHHLRYFCERKIWEYEDEHLMVLCRQCHEKAHEIYEPKRL